MTPDKHGPIPMPAAVQPEPERPQWVRLTTDWARNLSGSIHEVSEWDEEGDPWVSYAEPIPGIGLGGGFLPASMWEPADAPVDEPAALPIRFVGDFDGWADGDETVPVDWTDAGEPWVTASRSSSLLTVVPDGRWEPTNPPPAPPVEPWKEGDEAATTWQVGDWLMVQQEGYEALPRCAYRVFNVGVHAVAIVDTYGQVWAIPFEHIAERCDPPVVDEPGPTPQTDVAMAQGLIDGYLAHHDPDALVCNSTPDVLREAFKLLMAAAPSDPEMVAVMLPRQLVERRAGVGIGAADRDGAAIEAACAAALRQGQNQQEGGGVDDAVLDEDISEAGAWADHEPADQQEGGGR